MNSRERFIRCMHFEPVDHAPWWEMWYWPGTLERWYREGLPRDVHLAEYFGLERRENAGIDLGLVPPFEEEVLSETEEFRVRRRADGVVVQELKDRGPKDQMPRWLEFPIKTRADWEEFKKRLDPNSPCRYPPWWEDKKRCWRDRDYPLFIHAGSLYGRLRNWIGMENLAYLFYDDPI